MSSNVNQSSALQKDPAALASADPIVSVVPIANHATTQANKISGQESGSVPPEAKFSEDEFTDGSVRIKSLDLEARGVAHRDGKVLFIEGALLNERVTYKTFKRKSSFETGEVKEILQESFTRVKPLCPHFGVCGGCSMQHLEPSAQIASKQRVLEDNLWHLGKLRPVNVARPIAGPTWGYRYRARLSVRYVRKKNEVLIGFHERKSTFIANMTSCAILPKHVSDMLVPLRGLIGSLEAMERIPQIELAIGQGASNELVTVLVLRVLDMLTNPLSASDQDKLKAFADANQVQFWLQPKGPETATLFYPPNLPSLAYYLPEFGVEMPFRPTDFTQVNHYINRVLVSRALQLLDPQPNEVVADLFCGIGNFTLPLATKVKHVVGIEGSDQLTERALANAQHNGLAHKTQFYCRNLFEITQQEWCDLPVFDKLLIDPPRDGAQTLVTLFADMFASKDPALLARLPKRIVYVSCKPATLARDAGILKTAGYELKLAGVVNMFPHTSHVESIAWFEKSI